MRKRILIVAAVVGVVALVAVAAWVLLDLPPPRLVVKYGFSYGPEPTGRTLMVEGVEFVEIGPGCFLMGTDKRTKGGDWLGQLCERLGLPWGERPEPSWEMPEHWVEFSHGFWIARTEVSNQHYEGIARQSTRNVFAPGDRNPVIGLSGEEAEAFCTALSELAGLPVRLPSSSEWECACRAGTRTTFSFGDDEDDLQHYGWFLGNSGRVAHDVGTRQPNHWGLYDLHGNVWEWCADDIRERRAYEISPADGTAWKLSEDHGPQDFRPRRVVRGGGFGYSAAACRSASMMGFWPWERGMNVTLRPAFQLNTPQFHE